jgi:hypothetical protein
MIEDKMKELSKASHRLLLKSAEIIDIIRDTRDQINATNVGVSAWLDDLLDITKEEWDETISHAWIIGYAKLKDGWDLAARKVTINIKKVKEKPIPLTSAPRKVRMEAVPLLPKIIEALAAKADSFAEDIDRVTKCQ